jgi:Right handed beta helix region
VRWLAAVPLLVLAGVLVMPRPSAITRLPAGVVLLHHEMLVQGEVVGDPKGTVLRMAPDFQGRAAVVVRGSARLHDFTIEGNGEIRAELPPWNVPFARFTRGSGILIEGATGVNIERVTIRHVGGFAVLANRARRLELESVFVYDSGSRNAAGKNNTTGGILLEEGTTDFEVSLCELHNVMGNGVWTHSLYTSPRNWRGWINDNTFDTVGRDAIQVGHALEVSVHGNGGGHIGYPKEIVDATPAALDTAGNVEKSWYTGNGFRDINGKCIDLDGFHDGEVRGNSCTDVGGYGIVFNNTNPDMQSRNIRVTANTLQNVLYGGIFIIGTGHTVASNKLLNLNTSHCDACGYLPDEPDMLDSGIYLGRKAERPAPARNNVIENNEITGYKMKARCVGHAPGIDPNSNTVRDNRCRD